MTYINLCLQLEDVDIVVGDHVQKVMKPNFGASWDEVGPDNELEDTFALSTMKTLEGLYIMYFIQFELFVECILPLSLSCLP